MEIRPTTAADGPVICELFAALSVEDRYRRFFGAFQPDDEWCRSWAAVGERGGSGLLALVHDGDRATAAGEAGYALRADGDGDLAVTVAPGWRGWLGSYLIEVLTRHAAANGIRNLQAEVMLDNRPMLAVLRRRVTVNLEHSIGMVRLSIGTGGRQPTWPPVAVGPRVLIEAAGGRWSGEADAADAGLVSAVCQGPGRRREPGCPVLHGEACALADEADAIVILLDPHDDQTQRLAALHRARRPGVPVLVAGANGGGPSTEPGCAGIARSDGVSVTRLLAVIGHRHVASDGAAASGDEAPAGAASTNRR